MSLILALHSSDLVYLPSDKQWKCFDCSQELNSSSLVQGTNDKAQSTPVTKSLPRSTRKPRQCSQVVHQLKSTPTLVSGDGIKASLPATVDSSLDKKTPSSCKKPVCGTKRLSKTPSKKSKPQKHQKVNSLKYASKVRSKRTSSSQDKALACSADKKGFHVEGDFWKVNKVLKVRFMSGKMLCLVRWKGCTSDDDSWLPAEDLTEKSCEYPFVHFEFIWATMF